MAPHFRDCTIQASPSTIWKTCIAPMKWEEWDPDVQCLEDVSGDCVNGTTLVFVMKEGSSSIAKIPVTLRGVQENQSLQYHGQVWGGSMQFDASIEITPIEDGNTSFVRYTFDMYGVLGSAVNWYNPTPVTEGVEKGLENIKRLSEAAAATTAESH